LRIINLTRDRVRLDCVDLVDREVPVERTTWGRIKALYTTR